MKQLDLLSGDWSPIEDAPMTGRKVYVLCGEEVFAGRYTRRIAGHGFAGWVDGRGNMLYPQPNWWSEHRPKERRQRAVEQIVTDDAPQGPVWPEAIYIAGAEEMAEIKVGRSADPAKRLATMQSGCPYKLHMRANLWCSGDVSNTVEMKTHEILREAGQHVRGEWFRCTQEQAEQAIRKAANTHGVTFLSPDERTRLQDAAECWVSGA